MTVDQLIQLEDDRLETMASSSYQEWAQALNVSRLHINKEPLIKARLLNSQYDYSQKNKVASLIKRLYL
jgi:hypothetical protein